MRSHLTFFNHFPTRLLRNARRAFRAASILLWGAALFAGCTSDIEEGPGLQPEQPASENKLTLSISIPDVSASSPGTYALTTGEEGFQDGQDSFHVLLFGNQTDETTDALYEFMQFVEPKTDPSSTPGRRNFTIEIPPTDPNDPAAPKYKYYKAMVIANYTLEDGGSGDLTERWERYLEKHKDFAAAREKIQFSQAGTWNTAAGTKRYLPLYGESPAFKETVARIPNIEMRRAVARIDVGVNIGGGTPAGTGGKYPVYDLNSTEYNGNTYAANGAQFLLQSVTLYNAAGAGYVAHNRTADPDNDDLSYYVTPLQSDGVTYAIDKTETGKTNMFRREIYLPETPNKFDDDTRAFYIVVGGEYNNSGRTTYYRIDFYDREANGAPDATGEGYVKPTKDSRFNILRNNAYVINILEVRGPGHATEEIAAQSEPINMEVDVRSWDTGDSDLGNVVTDGQYNLSVSATRLRYHSDGTAQDLKVFTNYLLANMPEKSGWEMTVKRPDNMSDTEYDELQKQVLFFDDDGKTPLTFDDVKRGVANSPKTLHVGLKYFSGTGNQMERTVTLVFTAGRMRQEVELIQDVKSLNTLTLTPERLSFPKMPKDTQPVIVKSSPADAKYYVTWTDDGGTLRRMNISEPGVGREEKTDDQGSVIWESLGGVESPDLSESSFPRGFGDCKKDHADCREITFFTKAEGSENMFLLRPSNWDEIHNNSSKPDQPRSWDFEIEAYWDANSHIPGARATLRVTQSKDEVTWEVVKTDVSAKPDDKDAEVWDDNLIEAEWYQEEVIAYFRTSPQYPWYFVSKSDEGNLSGKEWVTNWNAFMGQNYPGNSSQPIKLTKNTNLQPRTVTFQASSGYEGFDRSTAQLKVRQKRGEVLLELLPGIGVTKLAEDKHNVTTEAGETILRTRYTLDFGSKESRDTRGVHVRANTDWWWAWSDADGEGTLPLQEEFRVPAKKLENLDTKTDYGTAYLAGKGNMKPLFLQKTHAYWENIGALPAADIQGYVIGEWLATPSVVKDEGKNNATTSNGDEKSYDRTWSNAFTMRPVQGLFLSPSATSDEKLKNRKVPHAGTYYSELTFYNKHKLLPTDPTEGTGTQDEYDANQAEIEKNAKTLRIQRTVPSLVYCSFPFDNRDNVNLSNYETPYVTDPNDEEHWTNEKHKIKIWANSPITVTLDHKRRGPGGGEEQVDVATYTLYPRSNEGYSKLQEVKLPDLGYYIDRTTEEWKNIIDKDDVDIQQAEAFHRYKVTISGYRQETKDQPDVPFTITRTYTAGYWMVHPVSPQLMRGGRYGSGGFYMYLDFSASSYGRDQKIRIGRRKVRIGDFENNQITPGGELSAAEYTEYTLDGSKGQCYVKHEVEENTNPDNMWIYWVEYQPAKKDAEGNPLPYTTQWSDNGYASQGEVGKYLFLQEAANANGLVFLQNGPTVPALYNGTNAGRDYWLGNGVSWWKGRIEPFTNQEDAELQFRNTYTPSYYSATYNVDCQITESEFFCASASGNTSDANSQYLTAATCNAYTSLHGNTRAVSVFLNLNCSIRGLHNMFGSGQHGVDVGGSSPVGKFGPYGCPDNGKPNDQGGHVPGIERKNVQLFEYIKDATYTTQAGNVKGQALNLMIMRRAITTPPGNEPYYPPSMVVTAP